MSKLSSTGVGQRPLRSTYYDPLNSPSTGRTLYDASFRETDVWVSPSPCCGVRAEAFPAAATLTLLDNITHLLGDDLKRTLTPGAKLRVAASCFSIYAYEALKAELEQIESLEFIFTSPTFVPNESLRDHIARVQAIEAKQREAIQLEAKLQRERQFNRKVELNQRLRGLSAELAALGPNLDCGSPLPLSRSQPAGPEANASAKAPSFSPQSHSAAGCGNQSGSRLPHSMS